MSRHPRRQEFGKTVISNLSGQQDAGGLVCRELQPRRDERIGNN